MVINSGMGFEVIKKLREERRWTLRDLANRVNSYPQQISKYELGQTELTIEWIRKFADVFEVPQSVILGEETNGNSMVRKSIDLHAKVAEIKPAQFGPETVPVLGIANGYTEALMLNFDEPIGNIVIHPNQIGMNGAFALYARGESMVPRYMPGDSVYAISNKPPAKDQDCIIELVNGESFLKKFIRQTAKEIICEQYNPVKEIKWPMSLIRAIHAVVGRG